MSLAGLKVRRACAADLAAILALERATVEAPHWPEAEYTAMLIAEAGPACRCLIVAERDDGLIGFSAGKVVGTEPESFAELETVAVAEEARRSGIGRALCTSVIDWCRAQNAMSIELEVRASSTGAIGLYTSLGFVTVGRRAGYYSDPSDDALLMRLDLALCG
jgi:ribosomal-protein-alanine N-acetyltransferase